MENNSKKDQIEKKIQKEVDRRNEKAERLGVNRLLQYIKEEHKWENYLFFFIALVVLVLGCLMLTGVLTVKDDFPVIGSFPTVFAWVLVGFASIGILYAIYPFFKPAFPEFKKITWLTPKKFLADSIRVFVFLIIFTALFLLYDSFITELLALVF